MHKVIHCKAWCWSWNSSTLATWCEEPTHLKRPWCWERLRAGGEGDGWMASLTQWTWVWVDSASWWWNGKPGVLWFMGSQRVTTERLNWTSSGQPSGPHPTVFDCRVPESRVFKSVFSGQFSTWHKFEIGKCWTTTGEVLSGWVNLFKLRQSSADHTATLILPEGEGWGKEVDDEPDLAWQLWFLGVLVARR